MMASFLAFLVALFLTPQGWCGMLCFAMLVMALRA